MDNNKNIEFNNDIESQLDCVGSQLDLKQISYLENLDKYELSEKDFYPPEDTRTLKSGVNDIANGDNFSDFTECFFDMCYEEEYFDDVYNY